MSWLPHRWRTQRIAIRNANCDTLRVIQFSNAHCGPGIPGSMHVGVSENPNRSSAENDRVKQFRWVIILVFVWSHSWTVVGRMQWFVMALPEWLSFCCEFTLWVCLWKQANSELLLLHYIWPARLCFDLPNAGGWVVWSGGCETLFTHVCLARLDRLDWIGPRCCGWTGLNGTCSSEGPSCWDGQHK